MKSFTTHQISHRAATIPVYVASHLMTHVHAFCSFKERRKKRTARLAMSLWYLEDNQHQNTIKYASSLTFAKKNIVKKMKRKVTALIS